MPLFGALGLSIPDVENKKPNTANELTNALGDFEANSGGLRMNNIFSAGSKSFSAGDGFSQMFSGGGLGGNMLSSFINDKKSQTELKKMTESLPSGFTG
jgi:hypothetical protein